MVAIIDADGLSRVELRHLVALAAVADHGSFTRAAQALGYTQSAISQQITALERALGERLVVRPGGPRPVRLTGAGEVVAGHARAVTTRLQALRADLAAFGGEADSRLRVGAYQSVSSRVLPATLQRFLRRWPSVVVELTQSGDDAGLALAIDRAELDIGFVTLPTQVRSLTEIPLLDDPYVFVCSKEAPLGDASAPLPLEALSELRLIGHPLSVCQRRLEEALRSAGVEPDVVFRSDDNATVQALVRAGIGQAVVPSLTIDDRDEGLVVRSLAPAIPPRRIGLVVHGDRHHSTVLRTFVDEARAECAAMAQQLPGDAGVETVTG